MSLAVLDGRLVLSRKPAESIDLRLDGELIVKITVQRISGAKVSMAVEANREIEIMRSELDYTQRAERRRVGLADFVQERLVCVESDK